jgi:hypothetical protein
MSKSDGEWREAALDREEHWITTVSHPSHGKAWGNAKSPPTWILLLTMSMVSELST